MRRARHSRASGREQIIDELFSTRGLEADPVGRGADRHFSLRPFAAEVPQDDLVNTEAASSESETDRLFRRAAESRARGRALEAAQRYREILALEPGHIPARHHLALLLESQGEMDEALDQLSGGLKLLPEDSTLLVARGAVYGRLKRYPEAEADLRRAIRHHPDHPEAHLTLGLVLWRKGLPAEAAESLRRSLTLDDRDAHAQYYLGEALNSAGDLPGARAALERTVELDPTNGKAFQLLGRILDRMNRPEEAMAMYHRAREARAQ